MRPVDPPPLHTVGSLGRAAGRQGRPPLRVVLRQADDEVKAVVVFPQPVEQARGYQVVGLRAGLMHAYYRLRRPEPLMLADVEGRAGLVVDRRWRALGALDGLRLLG